jgi:hypothetical protein
LKEIYKGREEEEEDVGSYWKTLRKKEALPRPEYVMEVSQD